MNTKVTEGSDNASEQKLLEYGLALEAVKKGEIIARKGWNGKNLFVFARPADTLDADMIVSKVKSLPGSFKEKILQLIPEGTVAVDVKIDFSTYLCIYDGNKRLVTNGWVASTGDTFANDWYIVK